MAKELSDEDTIQQVVDRLREKLPDTPRSSIETVAREEFDKLSGRPVKNYLAILVEQSTKKRLKKSDKSSD